eukprot:7712734-Pyramimonas_sp.AAC.1
MATTLTTTATTTMTTTTTTTTTRAPSDPPERAKLAPEAFRVQIPGSAGQAIVGGAVDEGGGGG